MRRALIAANWKMYLDRKSATFLAESLKKSVGNRNDRDVLVCPAAPLLSDVARVLEKSPIMLGGQNMYCEKEGAFTGEVSADMLLSIGCSHVLLGHSERRHVFGEDDELINRKVLFALQSGLAPVLCVGELLEQRETGSTEEVVYDQVMKGLKGVDEAGLKKTTIAYEPVWAIGTGKTATPEDADTVQSYIRRTIAELYSGDAGEDLRILYGGSVKPDNIDGLMAKDNVDGALVGGASLKADSFGRIIAFQ
jgi:triosephosphate isomerase